MYTNNTILYSYMLLLIISGKHKCSSFGLGIADLNRRHHCSLQNERQCLTLSRAYNGMPSLLNHSSRRSVSTGLLLQQSLSATRLMARTRGEGVNPKKKKRRGIIAKIFRRSEEDEITPSSQLDKVTVDNDPENLGNNRDDKIIDKLDITNSTSVSDKVLPVSKDVVEESPELSSESERNVTDAIPANTHLIGMSLNENQVGYANDSSSDNLMDEIELALESVEEETDDDPKKRNEDSITDNSRSWPFQRKNTPKLSSKEDEGAISSQNEEISKPFNHKKEKRRKGQNAMNPVSMTEQNRNRSKVKSSHRKKDIQKQKFHFMQSFLRQISPFGLRGMAKYLTLATLLFLFAPIPKRFSVGTYGDKYYAGNLAQSSIPFMEPSYQPNHIHPQVNIPSEDSNNENPSEKPILVSKSEDTETKNDVKPEVSTPETVVAKIQETFQDTYKKINNFEEDRRRASSSIAAAVRKVGPSVVRIDTKRFLNTSRGSPYSSPFGGLFDDFDQHEENGQGSGIIFNAKGFILTNAHVVSRADEVMVTLTDGRRYKAVVKGTDELTDLAVLQMQSFNDLPQPSSESPANKQKLKNESQEKWHGDPLPVATFGNSDHVEVGEYVIAVGNPVGLDNTVTMGIVSAIKRSSEEVGIPNKKVPFIQTDAAINPGNSGGPLVNGDGEIIGINTCIRANAEGIGFAIPINKAKSIIYRLADGQTIQHGFVGMNVISITPDLARQQNVDPNSPAGMIPEVYGAMITMVRANAPAATYGLRRFDVILDIGGVSVKNAGDVIKVFDEAPVGKGIDVRVLRNNKELTISVVPDDLTKKILEARQSQEKQSNDSPRQSDGSNPRIFILPFQ